MRLASRLRSTTLGDLLGELHRARIAGTLELVEVEGPAAGRIHQVQLREGLVQEVLTSAPAARLGERLRSGGWVSATQLTSTLALQRQTEERLGVLLVEQRVLEGGLVQGALRLQQLERLERLFALRDAAVRFRVPRVCASVPWSPVALGPDTFLHGRPRARRSAATAGDSSRLPPPRVRALSVLGVAADASPDEVRRAFRRLAAPLHPDRLLAEDECQRRHKLQRFAELSSAYHLLTG